MRGYRTPAAACVGAWLGVLALVVPTLADPAPEPPKPIPPADVKTDAGSPPPADAAKADAKQPEPDAQAADGANVDEKRLREMIRRQAEIDGLPTEVAEAVAEVESGFNVRAVGGVGEIGLMQVMPSTARMLGFAEPLPRLFEPETNIRYGVKYLSEAWRMTNQDICATVMKYRAGHGETRYSQKSVAYCVRVRALLAERGFKVTGTVPVATFGSPAGSLGAARAGRVRIGQRLANGRVRVSFNWRPVDLKRRALDKAGGAGLKITQ